MRRRDFLSWLGLGAVSAVIPKPVHSLIGSLTGNRFGSTGGNVVCSQGVASWKDILADFQKAITTFREMKGSEGGSFWV